MDVTQEATDPGGEQGTMISKQEKQKIFEAVSQVEEKIAKLKLSIK
jgi:tetrahydromethanopterin S-methyltransferase subunit B